MAIREWWLDLPKKKNYDIICFSDDQLLDKSVKDELTHVIDATGMPSKAELDKGLQDILEDLVYVAASRIDKPRPSPEMDKIIEWLLKLAAE